MTTKLEALVVGPLKKLFLRLRAQLALFMAFIMQYFFLLWEIFMSYKEKILWSIK